MQSKNTNSGIIFGVIMSVIAACLTTVFSILFINSFQDGVIEKYSTIISVVIIVVMASLTFFTVLFAFKRKELLYKLGLICIVLLALCSILLYVLYVTGFWDKVDSVEDLREFIASYGGISAIIFLAMQILQVVVIPIPGVVAIGAGVLLFGSFWGAVLSLIGILAGSLIAFFIGRCLGYKVAAWLVGKENLDKGIELIRGKDKVILTFMFLFPFFPDDLLCFVSGLSSMSTRFFVIMISITRVISTFTTAYSVSGSLIPYNTWWGLLIWAMLILGCLFLVKVVYKHSEKIEKFFKKRKK